jgi:DNA-binding transcriptional MerR regulator
MRSGKLACLSGVSSDTLRYYERVGILPIPQRSPANYRDYPLASVQRVQLIQRPLKIGFSLDELKTILGERDRGGVPCRHVRKLLQSKIRDVESQLKHLMEMRGDLNSRPPAPKAVAENLSCWSVWLCSASWYTVLDLIWQWLDPSWT